MGHSQCGAVIATLDEMSGQPTSQSHNLRDIVDRVRPAVAQVVAGRGAADREAILQDAIRANVRASVQQLRRGSELLSQLTHDDGLAIVGAEYSLETGIVTFFDEPVCS